MERKTRVLIGLIAILAAVVVGWVLYRTFSSMVTTAEVVTVSERVPAGALIESDLLEMREVPRPLLDEAIYVTEEELSGRVAVVPLSPGMVIYRDFAVSVEAYRLIDDPTSEVVSFPVDPARAVGGQIQPGHRVDVWRLWALRPPNGADVAELTASDWATATLLVEDVPVVDVRGADGRPAARQPQVHPGQLEPQARSSSTTAALQIVTVAVPRDVAQRILTSVAEERAGAEIWVTLAPLVSDDTSRVSEAVP